MIDIIINDLTGSLEHSPSDSCRRKSLLAESGRANSVCDVQLREDLAEAMKEDHGECRLILCRSFIPRYRLQSVLVMKMIRLI